MATEDFSFPTLINSPPRFIESPPLWRSPSVASPHREETTREGATGYDHEGQNYNFSASKSINCRQRKSFSHIERGVWTVGEDCIDSENEKMDMLWEDLNEELSKTCDSGIESDMSTGKMVELGCVQALKLSKTGGHVISGKKPSFVVIMKVLKKFFLMHNSHRSLKNRPSLNFSEIKEHGFGAHIR